MPEHVHVHAPHELTEGNEEGHVSRRERWLEIFAALLLSLATVGIAWSGYQAARWSGIQAERYTQASAERSAANRASTIAANDRTRDLLDFNLWLEAVTDGDQPLAAVYRERFREEFRPAFEAWYAKHPVDPQLAKDSPQNENAYVLKNTRIAERSEQRAHAYFTEGREATEHADAYVFSTVFFAVVLFFAGISLRFEWYPMRLGVLVGGAVLLLYAVGRLFTLPTL